MRCRPPRSKIPAVDWTYLPYAATFIPLLLIVIVVHEGGHYLVAPAAVSISPAFKEVRGLKPGDRLGLTLEARPSEKRSYPKNPSEAFDRFARLNVIYCQSFSQLAQINRHTLDNLSSPVRSPTRPPK